MEGKWISPFVIAIGALWVRYSPRLLSASDRKAGASLREEWIFNAKKIVYRQTAPHIIAAIDTVGLCARNSVHSIVLMEHHDDVLYALCAYLNSTPFRDYYQSSTGETRKVFPQVHISSMKNLRVPVILTDPEASITRTLADLAREASRIVDAGDIAPEPDEVQSVLAEVDSIVSGLFAGAWRHTPNRDEPGLGPARPEPEQAGTATADREGRSRTRVQGSVDRLAEFFRAHNGWHARKDVLEACVVSATEWNAAITGLVASGVVERLGDRRGARYRGRTDRPRGNT